MPSMPLQPGARLGFAAAADSVKQFLAAHPGQFYCNRCLSNEFGVMNRDQVGRVTQSLRDVEPYRRGKVICVDCGDDRECIAYG